MWLRVISLVTGFTLVGCSASISSNLTDISRMCKTCLDAQYEPPWSDGRSFTCTCNEDCALYGDCCLDSPYIAFQKQRHDASFVCHMMAINVGVYMRSSCPPEWPESEIRTACEATSMKEQDPMARHPVTDISSGLVYRNIFCATCHQAQNLQIWPHQVGCNDHPEEEFMYTDFYYDEQLKREVIDSFSFNNKTKRWTSRFRDKILNCTILFTIPKTSKPLRYCWRYDISTCPADYTIDDIRSRCESYTAMIETDNKYYKNPHCALCNAAPLSKYRCANWILEKWFGGGSFVVLFDLSSGPPGLTKPCDDDQLYDPFFKRCRNIITEFRKSLPSRALYLSATKNTTFADYSFSIINCRKFLLEKTDYIIEGQSVYVDKYQKRFNKGEFNITNNGHLVICSDSIGMVLVDRFDPHMVYITLFGIGVSIVFLTIHLIAFSLVPELRNLPGKNMASLCIALIMAYISFMAGKFLQGDACLVVSILAFYYFLASFAWMLTISFDVWRTLRMSTSHLRISSGKQWHKFIVYSLCSWLVPAFVVMMAILVEFFIEVGSDWKPNFAANAYCWFGRTKPLMIFFVMPLAIVMLLNIVFFGSSAHIVYSTRSSHPLTTTSSRLDFRMYLRMAVMMGITWTTGLIAGILDFSFLWYIFTLLNTLQGLFIFLAFTCNDRVISLVCNKKKPKNQEIPLTVLVTKKS